MYPVTTAKAALVLGTNPKTLRRWLGEGRFSDLPEPEWSRRGFEAGKRQFTRDWLANAAAILGIDPNFDSIESAR